MANSYDQIKDMLKGMSRSDQYQRLLQTKDWLDFRRTNIWKDNANCTQCAKEEWPIWIQTMTDDELIQHRLLVNNNSYVLKKWQKENKDLILKFLGGEIEEDPTPILELNSLSGLKNTSERVILQLHHKRYFWDKLPWQYDRTHLQTLCYDCHMEVHKKTKITMYKDGTMTFKASLATCGRCSGSGYLDQYKHVQHGVCFDCWGSGNYYPEEPNWVPVMIKQ